MRFQPETTKAFLAVGCLLAFTLVEGCRDPEAAVLIEVATPTVPDFPPGDHHREDQFKFMLDSYSQTGALHTMTLCGDFQQLIQVQHWGIMMELDRRDPPPPPNRHGCSMFQCRTNSGSALLGRNFDHKATQMLAAWCYPDSGYASLGFIPLNQWGFTPDHPFDPDNPQHKRQLLSGPVTTIEGMNEKGVTITLASLDKQPVDAVPEKPHRFLIHLVREILDHAGNLDEAVAIAQRYNIFDNGRDIISHHIFLADPTSGSAVLEWHQGRMRVLPSGSGSQVVTNRPLYQKDPADLADSCRRFKVISRALEKETPGFGWENGMDSLKEAAQHNSTFIVEGQRWRVSTQWSAVFDMTAGVVYVCLDRDFETVFKLQVPSRN